MRDKAWVREVSDQLHTAVWSERSRRRSDLRKTIFLPAKALTADADVALFMSLGNVASG